MKRGVWLVTRPLRWSTIGRIHRMVQIMRAFFEQGTFTMEGTLKVTETCSNASCSHIVSPIEVFRKHTHFGTESNHFHHLRTSISVSCKVNDLRWWTFESTMVERKIFFIDFWAIFTRRDYREPSLLKFRIRWIFNRSLNFTIRLNRRAVWGSFLNLINDNALFLFTIPLTIEATDRTIGEAILYVYYYIFSNNSTANGLLTLNESARKNVRNDLKVRHVPSVIEQSQSCAR